MDTACAWRKVYNTHFPHSGLLRYWPGKRDGRDASMNADYFRFATTGWSAAPEVELPEIECPRTRTFVSGTEADMFRRAGTDDPYEPAAIEPHYWAWTRIPGAKWIWWRHWVTPEFQTGGAVEHKRDFELEEQPQQVTLMFAVDDKVRDLRINETQLADDEVGSLHKATVTDLTPHVRQGRNELAMTVVNVHAPSPTSPDDNPTGLCYRIDVSY